MAIEQLFLKALVLTIVIETAVIAVAWRAGLLPSRPKTRLLEIMAAGSLPSALTLPYLWFVVPAFLGGWNGILAGELIVAAAEAPLLAAILRIDAKRALVLSIACNAASFLAGGLLIQFL